MTNLSLSALVYLGCKMSFIQTGKNNGVFSIILNRPEIHNAFNDEMIAEITECFHSIEKDSS